MSEVQKALDYAHQNRERFLNDLIEALKIPSISTDPQFNHEVLRAAEWMANYLKRLGMENVEIMPTVKVMPKEGGHPVVYADYIKKPGAPTVLIYGHYDVQPPDPEELWETGPFEPQVRGDRLFGRGASDMKGQALATFHAIESLMKTGGMPVNLKFLLEGEEEIGSKNLEPFLQKHADKFKADVSLNPDAGMMGIDMPTITYGLRGLSYFEINVWGPKADLHSGLYGGAVHNPAQALAELIAKMHDEKGRVTLPGFYDSVRTLSPQEREDFARLPTGDAKYLEETGVPALWGERGLHLRRADRRASDARSERIAFRLDGSRLEDGPACQSHGKDFLPPRSRPNSCRGPEANGTFHAGERAEDDQMGSFGFDEQPNRHRRSEQSRCQSHARCHGSRLGYAPVLPA